jgi:hypothetical protein
MNTIEKITDSERYARCVQTSKRVRWDIDEDVIRGRRFEAAHKFLPDGLSLADETRWRPRQQLRPQTEESTVAVVAVVFSVAQSDADREPIDAQFFLFLPVIWVTEAGI